MAEVAVADFFSSRTPGPTIGDAQKVFSHEVVILAAGDAVTVDGRGMIKLVVEALAGATVTMSRVNAEDATIHGTGPKVITPPAAGNRLVHDVDWPFFRISTAGGGAEVGLV